MRESLGEKVFQREREREREREHANFSYGTMLAQTGWFVFNGAYAITHDRVDTVLSM